MDWIDAKPLIFGERRNFFGKNTGSTYNGLLDNPEDPALWFTAGSVSVAAQETEFSLPQELILEL